MSFRSSVAKAMPANTDQPRAYNTTSRAQEGDNGGTEASNRFVRSRLAAAPDRKQTEVYSNDPSHPRKASSTFTLSTMSNDASRHDANTPDGATGQRPYLSTRRRQSSIPNARLPQGPRLVDLQSNRRVPSSSLATQFTPVDDMATLHSNFPPSYEPSGNELNDFSFATIDPTKTVPDDRKDGNISHFSFTSEPTFNFDDFHDNIAVQPSLTHFPLPGNGGAITATNVPAVPLMDSRKVSAQTTIPAPTRIVSAVGSLSRKSSTASTAGRNYITKNDHMTTAATAPVSVLRGRRQSQFPPNAFNNPGSNPPPKAPRKSIGPGTFVPPELSEAPVKRRPSIGGRKSSAESASSNRLAKGNLAGSREGSKSPRTIKAKSILVPTRQSSKDLLTPSRTPDPQRISSTGATQTTPGKRAGTPGRTTTPGASKRMSLATGLGARTISPTDAKRMKRMSIMPPAPPVPHRRISQAPPTPQPDPNTSILSQISTQSPPSNHRKSLTPSSSRTTPDPNRKSYSSGQSLSSATSYGSNRNSHSIMSKQTQNGSGSRLPTPKPRVETTTNNSGGPEEIPPVPAIPKSYESPASEIDQPFFSARSSGLHAVGTPTSEGMSVQNLVDAIATLDQPRPPSSSSNFARHDQIVEKGQAQQGKNKTNHLNLRLPPLNLLPLSTPTTAKILSLKDASAEHLSSPMTPPGARVMKTPSTPMTASKATFFEQKAHGNEQKSSVIRSSTSHYVLRQDSDFLDELLTPSLPPFQFESTMDHRTMSPYISSSLPKNSNDFTNWMRPSFGSELKRTGTQQRPNGPRAPSYSVSAHTESSTPITDQSGGSTPLTTINTSAQNMQRIQSDAKLSDLAGSDSDVAKFDNMPPPKLPASATWSNLTNKTTGSPTQKSGFFRSRRKTSASSTSTMPGPERTESFDSAMTHVSAARPSLESVRSSIMTQSNRSGSLLGPKSSATSTTTGQSPKSDEGALDKDDTIAEEEMRKLASKRRDLEAAARKLDSLRARARPVKRVSPNTALQTANLNIFERGEIVDFPDVYFTGTRSAKKVVGDLSSTSTNFGYDDDRGDYNIVEGDHLLYRYEVVDLLGKGSFGQVVRCIDHKTGQLVAIKIIRNKKRFHQQALVEVEILQKLKEWDPQKRHNVVNFDQSFYFREHLCISTDLLDMNLYEFIKIHDFRGFSLKLIRRFTKQMLASLVLLHGKRVIHCDLKPENILLAHPAHTGIKVIDFGSSCFENEKVYTYIQSRFYRSPEVILGMSYGMPIDMWSVGCILAELFTGYPIFPGENEQEQLACIMEVFGPPEKHLIEKSSRKKLFFDSMGKPRLTVSSKGRRRRPSSKELRQVLKCDDESFLDFITKCLRWDPARRMNPHEALRHEFITGVKAAPVSSRRNIANNVNSPMKRAGTTATAAAIRPLPQPPPSNLRPNATSTNSTSPSKNLPNRRQSSVVNTSQAKRASHAAMNGTTNTNGNATRVTVAQRGSERGRTDLAAAAAAASLVR